MHFIIRISVACQFLLCLSESNWSMICCGFIEIHFHSVKLNVVASACIKVMRVRSNTLGDLYIQNLDINYRTRAIITPSWLQPYSWILTHGLLNIWMELLYLTCPHEADLLTLIMSHKLTQSIFRHAKGKIMVNFYNVHALAQNLANSESCPILRLL